MKFESKISLVKILYYEHIESYANFYILESSQSKVKFLDWKMIVKIMKYL
jgi:hypothetical protein